MADNVSMVTEEVTPFTATVEIPVESWVKCGPQYEAIIEVPGLAEDGITEATFNEEKMTDINRSYAMKIISDVMSSMSGSEDMGLLEIKSKENRIEAIWFDKDLPKISIILDISQLPFR